jgi:hypothetical protein
MMSSAWRYIYDLVVILLCGLAVFIALTLMRPAREVSARRIWAASAWIASGMLSLRGVAGMLADGVSDLIWWPTFLLGGLLFGGVAWTARIAQYLDPDGLAISVSEERRQDKDRP